MEADVLNALRSQAAAHLPGGRDRDARLLMLISVPSELQPWTKRYLELSIKYLLSILSQESQNSGFIVVIDTQKCQWRLARSTIRQVTTQFGTNFTNVIVVRPDAFWDKQRVENCAKTHKKGEPITIQKSRLLKYFEISELPEELGGTHEYNHEQWLQNRVRIEEFKQSHDKAINDLENLHVMLLDNKSIRANETEKALKTCTTINDDVQKSIICVIDSGNKLVYELTESMSKNYRISQDHVDARESIKTMLNDVEKKQTNITLAWTELEKNFDDVRELAQLEDGVGYVTNWILGTAETLLNAQQKIGCDLQTCDELRRDHETMEMQCWETYGLYAELLHKIEKFPMLIDSFAHKDLMSQKDFMDFVCRSFATRLERRRNVLITSVRFYRMVSEYFDKTSEVFESLVMGNKIDDFEMASVNLQKLKDSQHSLDHVEKELEKEGEKLSDILSMPVKDALGRDIGADYSEDIATIRDILDATIARRNIFIDSVELQKLTLEQVTHIYAYEKDAAIAIKWIDDLYNVMIRQHSHVGCNVYEIQLQKEELQTIQETAKGTYNFGCQLLEAALALRHSCKLNPDKNREWLENLNVIWKNVQIVSQEQMTRLRVSAVFHRSIEDHCSKLHDLKLTVTLVNDIDDTERRRSRLRKYLSCRERLLVEVGRMVRLGRLLKTRLKEPFLLQIDTNETMADSPGSASGSVTPTSGNFIACDAITQKLTEVSKIAETLDVVLKEIQNCLDMDESSAAASTSSTTVEMDKKFADNNTTAATIPADRQSVDEWNSSFKSSTEDESFVTASDCTLTPQSRSSYRTASEGGTSPWWTGTEKNSSFDADSSDMDPEVPSMQLLSGVISSASASFDDSEHSFLSAHQSPMMLLSDTSDDAQKPNSLLNRDRNFDLSPIASTLSAGAAAKTGDNYQIKIVEIEPKLTFLGANIGEAVELQRQHDEVIKQLYGRNTPVDEFMPKAEELLLQKNANPDVLNAMGKSLNLAWDDVLKLMHQKKHILDLNANFHEKIGVSRGKMAALEVACRDTMIPIEIESVQEFLTKFKQLRIEVLASVMVALKEGNELLANLREVSQSGTIDSRPDHIKVEVKKSINQVEVWLEELHDRRNVLELAWQTRKIQLEQCLALAIFAKDLIELETTLHNRKNELNSLPNLGDSESSAIHLLQEYITLKQDAVSLRDKALKITRATEKLVATGCFAGDEACTKAYNVLSGCTEYLDTIDQIEHLLVQSKEFFAKAEKALSILEKLEIEVASTKHQSGSNEAISIQTKVLNEIVGLTEEPLKLGYALLGDVGRSNAEVSGIERVIEDIENRKIYLEEICSINSEHCIKISQSLNVFMEKYNSILSWLVSIAEAFLRKNNGMGSNQKDSGDFLKIHHQLLSDLETKGTDINNLLLSVTEILGDIEDDQRKDVDNKVESLHSHWSELRTIVENRVDLVSIFLQFLQLADSLSKLFEYVETILKSSPEDEKLKQLDSVWAKIKPAYAQLKLDGARFIDEASKVADPYLETKSACSCVEEILNSFSNRQFGITESWENWTCSLVEKREIELLLETIMTENIQTINSASKLDAQLYPIITTPSDEPATIKEYIREKLDNVLKEIGKASDEIQQKVHSTAQLQPKDESIRDKVTQVIQNLNGLKDKLETVSRNYRILLEALISFLDKIISTKSDIETYLRSKSKSPKPENVENVLREHEQFRENIMNKFRSLIAQSEQIIESIRAQEPDGAKEHDTDRILTLLEKLRILFETQIDNKTSELQKQDAINKFNLELNEIHKNFDDVTRQLNETESQNGDSSAAAKAVAMGFEYFERTIQLLEKRIDNFRQTSENVSKTYPNTEQFVGDELRKLLNRWEDLKNHTKKTRNLIDSSADYYALADNIDRKYRDHHNYLLNITNQIPNIHAIDQTNELINKIDTYINQNEAPQLELLKNLANKSKDLYGFDKTVTIYSDNISLFQSFFHLKNQLQSLAEQMRQNEELHLKETERQKDLLKLKLEEEQIKAEKLLMEEQKELQIQEQLRLQLEHEKLLNEQKIQQQAAERKQQELLHQQKLQEQQAAFEQQLQEQTLLQQQQQQLQQQQLQQQQLQQQQIQQQQMQQLQQQFVQQQVEIVEVVELNYEAPVFTQPLCDATIQEGDKIRFECHATGNPEPTIEWFKDGLSIQNNPDYHRTYDKGICTLSIEETFTEDSARFTCKASNCAGVSETTAKLSVKESTANEMLTAPTFLKLLENGTAKEGSSFEFHCTVSGNPLPTVQWFKNDICIDNAAEFAIFYNNGDAVLRIEAVHVQDQAVFSCKASNEFGFEQCSAGLNVKPLIPTEQPAFTAPLSNIMARVGQKIKLECQVSGNPRPDILWTHNGKEFIGGRDIKSQYDNQGKITLVIQEAFPSDAGVYIATAKNSAGEAYSSCNVCVKGRLLNETSDSEMASDMEPVKPFVQLPLKDISVFEGKSVRLDCVIVGQPEPEVIWYHNNFPVQESVDVQLLFQGDRCSLIIQEAYLEDAGEYRVVALNSAGETFSECVVAVTPLNELAPATRPQSDRILPTEMPPKFERLLSDILADEGQCIEFDCSLVGDPRPSIKWYLNNKEIEESNRVKFVQSADGTVKLIILNVSNLDKGVYTVKASNSSGDAKCFSHLIVKQVNSIPATEIVGRQQTAAQADLEHVCPTFKELFADKTVQIDDVAKFECIVVGKPTPKIRWFFNDHPVQGKNFLISTSGERQVLTVPNVTSETIGKISCVAENEIGKATCVAYLNMIGDLSAPTSEQAQRYVEEYNTESSNITIKKQIFTTTHTSQVNSFENVNGHPQTQVHAINVQSDHSFKQIGQESPEIFDSKQFQEYSQINELPPTVQQKSIVNFIKPNNGEIAADALPKVVRKNIAPRFVAPLIGKIVDQGSDVMLEAIVDGFPSPQLKITRNGEELMPNSDITISYQLNKVNIELRNVGVKDAGRYSCSATNAAGSSTSTADIVVKKSVFPPVFGHRLQAQVVKRGERVLMDVEVSGTPDPTVTWYKDNQLVENSLASEYKIKQSGNNYTLIIDKVKIPDAGKYMVRAVNAGGEAQSIADFAVLEPTPERMVEVVKTVVFDKLKNNTSTQKEADNNPSNYPESFHSSQLESSTAANDHGMTEQTIITETRRTTEATMRMEHKDTFTDIPLTFTQNTQTQIVPVTSEGTMIEPSLNSMGTNTDKQSVQTDSTQTPPQLLPKPLKVSVDADTLIDTTSIPKSAALDYFTNKINSENEAPSSPLEEKYTRFEDLKKPILSTPEFNAVKNEMVMKGPPQQVIKPLSKLSAELLDMNLVPGSPPEIGYMPKLDGPQRENISDRIKKLADNHKENPDGPQGGVRMLPQLTQQREEIKTEIFSQQTVQSHTGEPIMRPQARHIVDPDPFGLRSPSPRPSADGVAMEKLWTHPKHIENDKPFDTTSYHMSKNEFAEEKMSFKKFSSFSESDSDMKHEVDSTSESESNRKISTRDTAKMFENKIKDLENSPRHDYDLKAPGLVKQLFPKPQPERPRSVQEVPTLDIHLEPGTPPEVFYAPRTSERKQSLVESMEHKIEQILEKEPSKVIPGAVRTIPPPTAPTENVQNSFPSTQPKHVEFSNFPTTINAAPIVPSTFLQNSSTEKSYQSDFSATSTNWQPKEPQEYRSVKSPNFMTPRAKSTEPIVQSPCQFEQPPHPVNGNYHPHIEHIKTTFSAPPPTEPKPKQKVISGYMADTEESVYRKTMTSSTEQKYESLNKRVFESFNQFPPQSSIPSNINNQTRANFSVDPHHIPPNIAANNNNTKHYRHYIHKHDPKDETSGQYEKEFSSSSMVKNISMNSKHIKISEEPRLEPLPFVPEPARPRSLKVPPPPSPSKFIKGEFKESDYESDYDRKIAPVWKPSADSDSEPIYYKPIHPILTPTGRNSNISSSDYRSPVPPTEFERPLHFEGPPRPKFEPIDKPTSKFEPTAKPVQPSQLFKPKPVNAKPQVIYQPQPKYQQPPVQPQYQQPKPKPQQFTPPKPQPQPQQQTRYYTAVAGPPQHIASETSNTMHMRESTESSHRVVNMTQTKRVIQFDARKSEYEQKLEPFPYAADPQQAFSRKHHLPPPPTPTKFIPSECRESDYESEIESAKIRPLWTPNPSDNDDPHYRRVNAPAQSRSASLPRTYGRVLTPMEFDNKPIEMPSKIIIDTSSPEFTTVRKTQTLDRYSSKVKKQTVHRARDDMDLKPASPPKYGFIPGEIITEASSQMHNLNSSFKTRSRQFMNDVADSRVNNIAKPILKKPVAPADTNGPQAYREESRVSQYGTKHIDPDTGLIYFKYDFGYEFGIIFPGQGKKIVGGTRNVTNESTTKKPTHTHYASAGDISIPVVHEKTHNSVNNGFSASTPPQQDFPNYFESDPKRKRYSLPAHIINIDRLHQSPERHTAENYVKARSTTPIYLNNANGQDQLPKRKPIFITPLKDIAVVNGQTARFECIVQCDPYPTIAWSRNGVIINKDHKHNVEFRNGVCRLTIPQAFSNDAGTYSCTGTNHLGSVTTSADLLVPGDHWGSRK